MSTTTVEPLRSQCSCTDYTAGDYRRAAVALWGEAGAVAHDLPALAPAAARAARRAAHRLGITAYGHCVGLTRVDWTDGPRITIASSLFAEGRARVADTMIHEMLHA